MRSDNAEEGRAVSINTAPGIMVNYGARGSTHPTAVLFKAEWQRSTMLSDGPAVAQGLLPGTICATDALKQPPG